MSRHTDNAVTIEAPLELVWDRTNDIEGWTSLFSEYGEATVLDRSGDTVRFRLALHPDETGKVWTWVSERTVDRDRRRTWSRRVETGPFRYMFLYWEYREVPGGVRMRWVQDFEMETWAPLDDTAMQARLDRNTGIQMDRIKSILEAEHRAALDSDTQLEGSLS